MSTQRKLLNSHALAVYQAAALKNKHNDSESMSLATDDEAALMLQRHRGVVAGANGNLKLTRELIECLAMAQGVHDGLAGLGVDSATYEYMPNHHCIRIFCSAIPIPFSAFDGIRRSRHVVALTEAQEENVMNSFNKLVRSSLESNTNTGSNSYSKDADTVVNKHMNSNDSSSDPIDSENATTTAATTTDHTKTTNSSNNDNNAVSSSSALAAEVSVPLPFVSAFFDQRCPELRSSVLSNSRCGATYLLLAVITGHTVLCERCLEAGMSPNHMTFLRDGNAPAGEMFHGFSPLFMAVLAEQVEILDLLWRHGGRVWVYDRWGRTPLHAAVAMNSNVMVQWLLAHGSPRYVGDCLNLTPAEGANEEFYFLLAIPNLALHSFPVPQKRSVVLAPSCLGTAGTGANHTMDCTRSSTHTTTTALATHAASGEGSNEEGVTEEDERHCPMALERTDNVADVVQTMPQHISSSLPPPAATRNDSSADENAHDNRDHTYATNLSASTPSLASAGATTGCAVDGRARREEVEETGLCHCGSGRPSGYCGCVDDMFLRWSSDRLRVTWSAGVDYTAIAQRHVRDSVRKHRAGGTMGQSKKR